jgi:hypothetical protein
MLVNALAYTGKATFGTSKVVTPLPILAAAIAVSRDAPYSG